MDFWTAIIILAVISAVVSISRAKYGVVKTKAGEFFVHDAGAQAENVRLRDELRALRDELRPLKERVAILERIATDGNTVLDREIERLRDRP